MKTHFLSLTTTRWLALLGSGVVGCSSASAVTESFDFDADSTSVGSGAGTGTGGSGTGAGGGSMDGGEPTDGPIGDVVIPPGGGVGAMCSASTSCRAGLTCSPAETCQPSGTQPVGTPCVVNAECADGNVCNYVGASRQCAPGGMGTAGTSCATNAECGKGLRCSLSGFGAACTPDGTVDVNGTCKSSAECLGGLTCFGAKCSVVPPGIPPFGLPTWAGETCETDMGPAISYFRVPRGTGDKDFYRLPFPNDIRMKNGHPDLTGHPTPGSELLGFDAVDRYLRAIEADNDGFSPYSTIFFRFSAQFDIGKDNIDFVDLTAGPDFGMPATNGMHWLLDYGRNAYICPNYFALRTLEGSLLKPGHTYGVLLHGVTVSATGAPFGPDADFTAMLGATAPADATLATAYAAYKPLRDYITAKSVAAGSLVNAAIFTVGHPGTEVTKVQQAVQAAAAPVATGWVKCGAGASPCPDATGDRACDATADPAFDEYHALVSLPIFQSGAAPYLAPPSGRIDQNAPTVVRTENVCMALTVPKGSAMPASGWPLLIYAHGTGGSFRSHIREGVAKALATVGGDNTVAIAVLGIDQVEHGPRRGTSTDTPDNLFYNFANPNAARDNAMQGAADQMSLARFAATLDIIVGGGTQIKANPAAIAFWGHSQGATEGGISAPYTSQLGGVVFSGQGASLIDALLNKTQPVNIAGALAFALSDLVYADPKTHQLRGDIYHPVLSLLQTYLDPSDPLNHAAMIAPAGTGGHHVFQVYGQNDSYAPPITEVTYAVAANLAAVANDPKVTKPDFEPCGSCSIAFPTVSAGSITKNHDGRLTAVVRQYAALTGVDGGMTFDGHFVAYQNPLAQRDVYHFLDDIAKGVAPTVAP